MFNSTSVCDYKTTQEYDYERYIQRKMQHKSYAESTINRTDKKTLTNVKQSTYANIQST